MNVMIQKSISVLKHAEISLVRMSVTVKRDTR